MKILIILILSILLSSCKSFLMKEDYLNPSYHLKKGEYSEALKAMPGGESGTFITIMEMTFLKLLAGNPDIDRLREYSDDMEKRIRFKVSRELKSFFYLETPEGYYASEHEIIWMHIMLSWGYCLRKDFVKARVEAKRVSDLLRIEWSSEGRFDDPLLRVILAGLWHLCDDWDEAQVHIRAAHSLDPSLAWAKELGVLKEKPQSLFIILGGPGQEPQWDPNFKSNPFRGFRGVVFRNQGLKSNLLITDSYNKKISTYRTPDSSRWYVRHFVRDNAIHELIEDSRYSEKAVRSALEGGSILATGIVIGTAVVGAGFGLGGLAVYAGLKIGSLEIIALGAILGGSIAYKGGMVIVDASKRSKEVTRKGLDASVTYRFVRFLPEYAWVGWSNEKITFPVTYLVNGKRVLINNKDTFLPNFSNSIIFGHYPDSAE